MTLLFITGLLSMLPHSGEDSWQFFQPGTDADFRGLALVNSSIVWASGTKGTVIRTMDGGKKWDVIKVPDAEKLDFRDIEASSADVAHILSIGPGESSRIYKSIDGGKSWKLTFKNSNPKAFYDALAFWDEMNGIAMSDPVDGKFPIITTNDGGESWKLLPADSLPKALPNEGAFAASGTCLITQGKNDAWLVTGGAKSARVLHSTDRGRTWSYHESPMLAGIESAGIFSIAMKDSQEGILVGGDYKNTKASPNTAARTEDGGKSWKPISFEFPYLSSVAWQNETIIAVGTAGSYRSKDNGKNWISMDKQNLNTTRLLPDGTCWAVGPKGKVARLNK